MRPASRNSIVVLSLLAVLLAGWLAWRAIAPAKTATAVPDESSTRPRSAPSASASDLRPGPIALAPSTTDLAPSALARVVAANSGRGRILFLEFAIDPTGLRLTDANGAAGRAKPGATRAGPGFIAYEIRDGTGRVTHSGAVEDPRHRRLEYPADDGLGGIRSVFLDQPAGRLDLRIPGESLPDRLVFFAPIVDNTSLVQPQVLAEFNLRPDR